MIFFLTTPIGSGHIEKLVRRYDRSYSRHLIEMTYTDLLRRGRASGGVYIFTDVDRMSPPMKRMAGRLWEHLLAQGGNGVRLLNNPRTELCRYEYLRLLYEKGVNRFNVFRIPELSGAEVRFPVFVRLTRDHGGPKSDLLTTPDELWRAIERLVLAGAPPSDVLITEFVDIRQPDGRFAKYGAFRIGERIIGQHLMHSYEWNTKGETRIRSEEERTVSDDYFLANPHAERLHPLFDLANVDYGRIDYGLDAKGGLQVWEINDNPLYTRNSSTDAWTRLNKGETYFAAFMELQEFLEPIPDIPIDAETVDAGGGHELEIVSPA